MFGILSTSSMFVWSGMGLWPEQVQAGGQTSSAAGPANLPGVDINGAFNVCGQRDLAFIFVHMFRYRGISLGVAQRTWVGTGASGGLDRRPTSASGKTCCRHAQTSAD